MNEAFIVCLSNLKLGESPTSYRVRRGGLKVTVMVDKAMFALKEVQTSMNLPVFIW